MTINKRGFHIWNHNFPYPLKISKFTGSGSNCDNNFDEKCVLGENYDINCQSSSTKPNNIDSTCNTNCNIDKSSQYSSKQLDNDEESSTNLATAATTSTRLSPSNSIRNNESQTNSNSSLDGSALSGYVHIKPATFEIISKSSVLEDAQKEIDNLTKAYLDSENTNSLLSDQVKALKEEIRRMQRGNERMDLAENLEYLKNIVFKFISLDNGQLEQKQRLIPVLSTVLKLSPEETTKLYSQTIVDKPSMANSFFKL